LSTAQPKRGRQSTAKRAKRAEFIERSETVDGRRSGGYRSWAKSAGAQKTNDVLTVDEGRATISLLLGSAKVRSYWLA